MLGEINRHLRPLKYELTLHKPDNTTIAYLTEAYNIVYSPRFLSIDELEFKIPYYLSIENQLEKNPNWDLVQGDYKICLTEIDGKIDYDFTVYAGIQNVGIGTTVINYPVSSGGGIEQHIYKSKAIRSGVNFATENFTDTAKWDDITNTIEYVVNKQMFVINKVETQADDKEQKTIHCYSLEYELNKKIIRNYKAERRLLYSEINEKDEYGIEKGILNYLIRPTITSWTLDTNISSKVNMIPKDFDIPEKTLLEVLIDIQKTFKCIFTFDTFNKIIHVKSMEDEEMNVNSGLFITGENYIKTIGEDIDHDEIITRLYAYGKDISLHKVNPTGAPYIEKFDFYKNTNYMSQDLIDALDNYESVVLSNQDQFQLYLTQLSTLNDTLYVKNEELSTLESDLKVINDSITAYQSRDIEYSVGGSLISTVKRVVTTGSKFAVDNYMQLNVGLMVGVKIGGTTYTNNGKYYKITALDVTDTEVQATITPALNNIAVNSTLVSVPLLNQKTLKEQEITTKKNEITGVEAQIDVVETNISDLGTTLNKGTYFTSEQLEQLDFFIRERTWQDNNYVYETDLMNEASKMLIKLCQPPVKFEIDVIDFLKSVECQYDWGKLKLGYLVNVQYERFNVDTQVRLVGYTHDIDGNSIELEFTNRYNIDSPYVYLQELLNKTVTTSTTIDLNKTKWDKVEQNTNEIEDIINNNLDATKNKIVAGSNQNITIDEHGIILRNTGNSLRQLGLINDAIAFTNDGWATSSLAISPEGVVADKLYGRMLAGERLTIVATDASNKTTFQVDANGVTLNGGALTISGGLPVSELAEGVILEGTPYNGVVINQASGIVVTNNTNMARSVFNATQGIKLQKNIGTAQAPQWSDVFYLDNTTGDATFKGTVIALDFKDKNGNTFLTTGLDGIKIVGNRITSISTDQLTAGTAKITTAMIEALEVGKNVTMGTNASISWNNISSKPFIPQSASDVGARPDTWTPTPDEIKAIPSTYIDASGIWTKGVYADKIVGTLISGVKLRTSNTTTYVQLQDQWIDFVSGTAKKLQIGYLNGQYDIPYIKMGAGDQTGRNFLELFKDDVGLNFIFTTSDNSKHGFYIRNSGQDGYANGALKFTGVVDFRSAQVLGGGGSAGMHIGSSAPSDTNLIWFDIGNMLIKYYNGTSWKSFSASIG